VTNPEGLLEQLKEKMTLDGRKRVFEDGEELSSDHLKTSAKPEDVTVDNLIRPLLDEHNIEMTPQRKIEAGKNDYRWADFGLETTSGEKILLEAKPLNQDLEDISGRSALEQIQGLFRYVEARQTYSFGIATDGSRWIVVDNETRVVYDIDIREDYDTLKQVLSDQKTVSAGKIEEEISEKFYRWYDSLLHGGSYKDHDDNKRSIAREDCLVENINYVDSQSERRELAQKIMDRLIFLRFLESKGIIDFDLLDYLSDQRGPTLNATLKQLFFRVLARKQDNRVSDIDERFEGIPYLNGSLFTRSQIERDNPNYTIESEILKEVIDFLNSFKFLHSEDLSDYEALDPQILGYIFERAMTDSERKGTGAYYTPSSVTDYIVRNTVEQRVIDIANGMLREKGYKESELIDEIDELYNLRETTLSEVFEHLTESFYVCDNACGSGAFLLASANTILGIYETINEELRLRNSDTALRKIILRNNIYGVDINPNAIEIAKLRLWLWVVESYGSDNVEPLPNIDYNLRTGNTLIGFSDISKFEEKFDSENQREVIYYQSEKAVSEKIRERQKKVQEYKNSEGEDARDIREEINELDDGIDGLLDTNYYRNIRESTDLTKDDVRQLQPFHWGFEFKQVMDDGGFDVIVGNPPYVRQEGLADIKPFLKSGYDVYHGRADLYTYFFQRGIETIKSNGQLGFIVSNKWLRTSYGEPLREYLNQYRVQQSVDFEDTEVFKGVAAYPCIIILQKRSDQNSDILSTKVQTENFTPLEAFVSENHYYSSQEALGTEAWSFPPKRIMGLIESIESRYCTLEKYVEDKGLEAHYGVKTGHTEAFRIDRQTKKELIQKDPASEEVIKPFLTGRYIRRYNLSDSGEYVIFTRRGIDIDGYPAVKEYLSQWKDELEPKEKSTDPDPGRKPGDYKWFELQDTIDYWREFEKPKIIYGKFATAPRFALDNEQGVYFNDASWMIRPVDKRLLGVLNSAIGWFLIKQKCTKIQSGYQLIWDQFKNIPVPETLPSELEDRVEEIQTAKKEGEGDKVREISNEIDEIVFNAYDLSEQETDIVRNQTSDLDWVSSNG
jgi:methylase of polypeptide subunit release factors